MDKKTMKKRLQDQYKRQNEFNKENYDRINVMLPKGTRDRIAATGETFTGFITRVVLQELEHLERSATAADGPQIETKTDGEQMIFK